MRENIGFKSYGGVWYMLFLFAVFGGLGIWMLVAERWSIGFLAFGIAFAAIGAVCAAVALWWLLRPRVLIRADEHNLYVWRRRGVLTVPFAEIVQVSSRTAKRSPAHQGTLYIEQVGGRRVRFERACRRPPIYRAASRRECRARRIKFYSDFEKAGI